MTAFWPLWSYYQILWILQVGTFDKPSVYQKHQTNYFREMKLRGPTLEQENKIYHYVSPYVIKSLTNLAASVGGGTDRPSYEIWICFDKFLYKH